MPEATPQTFENHARIVPLFHLGTFGIFVINLLWSAYRVARIPGADSVVSLLVAVGLLLLFFFTRTFPLAVQNRLIRLEMQLRMRGLLPADLQGRIDEFTPGQLIALRFASDEELPDLCRTVLTDRVTDHKAIKKMIKKWRPDYLRV